MARILVVDDDEDILVIVAGELAKRGYTVMAASSGEKALEVLENFDADILLADHVMPGIGGAELILRVMHLYPDMVISIISGVIHEIPVAKAAAFFRKPVEFNKLHNALQRELAKKSQ